MYHIHTHASEYSERVFQHILSVPFTVSAQQDSTKKAQLRSIADLSFDMLSQAQRMEKLLKMNQLSGAEKVEFNSIVRLIGTMIYLLRQYHYHDQEMMDVLVKRYQKYAQISHSAAA